MAILAIINLGTIQSTLTSLFCDRYRMTGGLTIHKSCVLASLSTGPVLLKGNLI